jgi:poly(3-hydroxybutyrate) depolymerase
MRSKSVLIAILLMVLGLAMAGAQATPLPALHTKQNETSVSGLSSGGYMAVQFHVANSSFVKGAGVIAGGPYFCAEDDQGLATSTCTCTGFFCHPDQAAQLVSDLVQTTSQNASQGAIDPINNLTNSRIWLFSGSGDTIVPTPIMAALETYYKNYVAPSNIFFKKNIPAEHAMPTDFFGNACSFKGAPFINDCGFDAAGAILKWIYGSLNPKNSGTSTGQLIKFDQSEFISNPTAHGMSSNGWVYVPASCQQNGQCRVHVAFHGCLQHPDAPYSSGPQGKIADTYVKNSGYNQWADTNNIVVLYPQANALFLGTRLPRINPDGCWDWWGYDDANYAVKNGHQMKAVKLMIDRLSAVSTPGSTPSPPALFCGSDSNASHTADGRAYGFFLWWYFANGSNDFLGFGGDKQSTLKEVYPGSYQQVNSCP